MKVIDLSHTIHPGMSFFPGTEPPVFTPANTLEKDGFVEYKISMYSHTGTHIDVPAHLIKDGLQLDQLKTEHFVGIGGILDVSDVKDGFITLEHVSKYEILLRHLDFVILKTGWSQYWESETYYQGFPFLTTEAAEYLARYPLKGVGIDTISIDDIQADTFSVHLTFLKKKIIVIENLTNLDEIHVEKFMFCCMPLKIQAGDGSPVRAIAIL